MGSCESCENVAGHLYFVTVEVAGTPRMYTARMCTRKDQLVSLTDGVHCCHFKGRVRSAEEILKDVSKGVDCGFSSRVVGLSDELYKEMMAFVGKDI